MKVSLTFTALKRTAAILLMTIYSVLAVGVHLQLHYCCGNLAGIEFGSTSGCCGTEENQCNLEKTCCSFESVDLSISDEHRVSTFSRIFLPSQKIIYPKTPALTAVVKVTETNELRFRFHERPLFLMHSSLVLYA